MSTFGCKCGVHRMLFFAVVMLAPTTNQENQPATDDKHFDLPGQ